MESVKNKKKVRLESGKMVFTRGDKVVIVTSRQNSHKVMRGSCTTTA